MRRHISVLSRGPSPRVRGSPERGRDVVQPRGSIPACAGKPGRMPPPAPCSRVHPRVCGEATLTRPGLGRAPGPSPRVRGSLGHRNQNMAFPGSIPACAGKPGRRCIRSATRRVHPRVCGEARSRGHRVRRCPGPSPRVRGSRETASDLERAERSIPACAGKPAVSRRRKTGQGVHPRVCGEARSASMRCDREPRDGSIPACAGKPRKDIHGRLGLEVHPRVCGEAPTAPPSTAPATGPSPRVRGSRQLREHEHDDHGSIPACAGKPRRAGGRTGRRGVHPRVCGEAVPLRLIRKDVPGPSPRVRGSRKSGHGPVPLGSIPACAGKPKDSKGYKSTWGSIPACAGKPATLVWLDGRQTVHPRVCGEATHGRPSALQRPGPSPRVRGSLRDVEHPAAHRVCGEASVKLLTERGYPIQLSMSGEAVSAGSQPLDEEYAIGVPDLLRRIAEMSER